VLLLLQLGAAGEAFFLAEVHELVEEEEYRTSPLVSPVQHAVKTLDGVVSAFPADASAVDPLELDKRLHDSQSGEAGETAAGSSVPLADPITEPRPEADDNVRGPPPASPEWHDTYRLERTPSTRAISGSNAMSERLAWGWGALPHMQSASIDHDANATDNEQAGDVLANMERHREEEETRELPVMIKSESVYFDAVESVSGAFGVGRFSEFPSSNSLIDLDPASLEANVPYISLCGHLLGTASSHEEMLSIFAAHMVSFEAFRADPTAILASPNLVALINGQLSAFTPEVQACLISRVLFPYSPPLPLSAAVKTRTSRRTENAGVCRHDHSDNELEHGEEASEVSNEPLPVLTEQVMGRHRGSFSLPALDPVDEVSSEGGASTQDTSSFTTEPYFKKSLLPSQADLRRMNLRAGMNDLSFVVTAAVGQAVVARVDAKLYLWPASSKIVIAQMDGAISRTSTGGMFKRRDTSSPLHEGAQAFFSRLEQNGYRIVYLTTQGLSHAEWIRTLLRPVSPSSVPAPSSSSSTGADDSSESLPHGPVLLSPDRLLEAASNEAIDAQEFKAAALDAVRALFPPDVNAFYAAFGKTAEDAATFARAGVFPGKVFVVDESTGRLRHRALLGFLESFGSLLVLADTMFPPILSPLAPRRDRSGPTGATNTANKDAYAAGDTFMSEAVASQARARSMADDAYNDVNFWRIKPGTI
jgi:phosphatidate phosphatase LPIN